MTTCDVLRECADASRNDLGEIERVASRVTIRVSKGFNCLVFERTRTFFSAPALGLDADYFSFCKTQLDCFWQSQTGVKLELDWIFQFNDWITTGSLRITTGLVLSPKTLIKKFMLLATSKRTGFREKLVKTGFCGNSDTTGLLWGRAGYYWIRFGEDWITIGLHALRPNWSYIFTGPVSFTLSG